MVPAPAARSRSGHKWDSQLLYPWASGLPPFGHNAAARLVMAGRERRTHRVSSARDWTRSARSLVLVMIFLRQYAHNAFFPHRSQL